MEMFLRGATFQNPDSERFASKNTHSGWKTKKIERRNSDLD